MPSLHALTPCLWFEDQAEEAARYYVGIFPDSHITHITRYSQEGHDVHGRPAGSVMVVSFSLNGRPFTALNGGPLFRFNEAVSFQVECETQADIDYYWEALGAGGDPRAQQCGWLKDRYGLSWQVVPAHMERYLGDETSAGARRAMAAMLGMKKIDLAALERARAGERAV